MFFLQIGADLGRSFHSCQYKIQYFEQIRGKYTFWNKVGLENTDNSMYMIDPEAILGSLAYCDITLHGTLWVDEVDENENQS